MNFKNEFANIKGSIISLKNEGNTLESLRSMNYAVRN